MDYLLNAEKAPHILEANIQILPNSPSFLLDKVLSFILSIF